MQTGQGVGVSGAVGSGVGGGGVGSGVGGGGGGVFAAQGMCKRAFGEPACRPERRLVRAVLTTCAFKSPGNTPVERKAAITPATCGAAIDVPLIAPEQVLHDVILDVMRLPGAHTSTQDP